MKVLITGGAGFVGSHLSEYLIGLNHEVVVVDNLSTGSLGNIAQLEGNGSFRFVQGDACDSSLMDGLISECDEIYHLAAAVGVQLIVDRPVHTIETNIHGTEVVLEASSKYDKKVLLASTSEVYGKSEKVPFHEDDDSVLGSTRFSRWSYACSKAIDEFLGFAYHQERGLEVVIARLFNTIGPRQVGKYGMVVPRFVDWALRGEDIKIYGDGKQSRCFACVTDVVTGLVGLMTGEDIAGRVYNVGTDREITISALADMVIERTGSSSKKKIISYQEAYGREFDDMLRRMPSLERINEAIGYVPQMDLESTLDMIIKSRRKLL
jgi:UDP-glucose 4-epimerase